MAADVEIHFDRAAMSTILESPAGGVGRDLLKRAIRVEAEAKRSLKQPGTGRVYRLSNPKRTHQASAPGAPPATDLGQLAASITTTLGADTRGLFAVIGSNLAKARYLELGTRTIKPRPFLRRALEKAR